MSFVSFIANDVTGAWNDVSTDVKGAITSTVNTVTSGISTSINTVEGWIGSDADSVRQLIASHLNAISQCEQDLERLAGWTFNHSTEIAGVLESTVDVIEIASIVAG